MGNTISDFIFEKAQVGEGAGRKNSNEDEERVLLTPNARRVLEKRYLRKDASGRVIETPEEMLRRVAHNIAQAERIFDPSADVKLWEDRFYEMMRRLDFLPNSPTLMNAGRELQQLSACFVLPIDDSIESIFEVIKNTALIHKSGGGTGFSFSRIRPRNDIVSTSHGLSSGPLSFMNVFNEATEAINQGGFRRGANMAVLRVDHPDILDFITAKADHSRLTNFNISVGITEDFMRKVEADEEYDLINPRKGVPVKKLKARKVFNLMVDMAWKSGEPGIVFLDRLNADNPTPKLGTIESTNPCGEQPLLPYESCNLGSINLKHFVKDKRIDYERLRKTVHLAVRFLDNVIEMNRYPLPMIATMTRGNRKIGLGVIGFADMLIDLGVPYDSDEAIDIAERVMRFINDESKVASRQYAVERGQFPNFKNSVYYDRGCAPLRNATTTTIAPTGTISIIAGATSGIEPLFAVCYNRHVLDNETLLEVHPAFERIAKERGFHSEALMREVARRGSVQGMREVPEDVQRLFVTAHDISPLWHVKMQAAFQKYTDNAVSKTVNFRHDATRDEIAEVYMLAYKLGCKGVTVYRDGCREGQVLTTGMTPVATGEKVEHSPTFAPTPRPRPDFVRGVTRKLRTGCGNIYVTLNYDEQGRPFEVFSIMGKAGGCAASQSEGIARLISFALRSGADVRALIKQLKGITCHSISWGKGGRILSCADAIAKALELALEEGAALHAPGAQTAGTSTLPSTHPATPPTATTGCGERKMAQYETLRKGACPDCGAALEHETGCVVCKACGYSECG